MENVNNFLSIFHLPSNVNDIFANQYSYWFAFILFTRFIRDGATIMFCSSKEHFGTMILERVYDITGDVTNLYEWIPWNNVDDDLKKYIINKYIMI